MDHFKLIRLIFENPQLWDHANDQFRNQHLKMTTWNAIANHMNVPVQVCKESFKALREKYIRERSKKPPEPEHKKWKLFDSLKFLEPHITARKQPAPISQGRFETDNDDTVSGDVSVTSRTSDAECSRDVSAYEFSRGLIMLVHQSRPLWDREHRDNHDKELKVKLWNTIAKALKVDVNLCTLKWKGLREKYIRQKQKYTEGRSKWEFLDELSFLDAVIQYRRKQSSMGNTFGFPEGHADYASSDGEFLQPFIEDVSLSESDGLYNLEKIKTESLQDDTSDHFPTNTAPDSTRPERNRKRKSSDASEASSSKKDNLEHDKTPEKLFGELVAAMLAKKSDIEKHVAMMQIMQILTKS